MVSIGKEGVCIESKGKQTEIPTDTVVIAAGYVPNHTLFDELIKLGVNAVSYTHLDVYKRQEEKGVDILKVPASGPENLVICLLYTSRCV